MDLLRYSPSQQEPTSDNYDTPPVPIPIQRDRSPITSQPTRTEQKENGHGAPEQIVLPDKAPPGLQCLTQLDCLIVKQKLELLEVCCSCESNNKYKVKDLQGKDLFSAKEDTDCCTRKCYGSGRPFDIRIKDMTGREVIRLSRPLACQSCLFPCCLQKLEVFAPPEELAGTVEQEWSMCSPKFVVKDDKGTKQFRIVAGVTVCGKRKFQILSVDGKTKVGKICKKWSGLLTEAFTDADNFGIKFLMDLDVRMKAVMLGACLLIDFMFYESSPKK